MIVVYCLDESYLGLTEISIKTVRQHNPDVRIVVVSERAISVNGADECFTYDLGGQHRNRGVGDRISNAAYLKLILPEILPYDKIIYIDGDTVCQKSLKELWDVDVEYIGLCESHQYGKKQAEELGLKKYGLSGMMLMNLSNLRRMNFSKECFQVEKKIPELKTGWQHDETVINYLMRDKLTFLPIKFNYCHNRQYDNPIFEKDAVILHIVGKDKSYMQLHYGELPIISRYPELEPIRSEIAGKRIAIIGNAKSIFDKQMGNEIDKHDFVIRFNRGFICDSKCQGSKTSLLILACPLPDYEAKSFNPKYIANRSRSYRNIYANFTINNTERAIMKEGLGAQPSSGFMAVNICLYFCAKSVDLYGFDGNSSPTFYNPENYKTEHNYDKEQEVLKGYESVGLIKIH